MLGNFSYKNATKLYFGNDSLKYLNDELPKYGKNVQLIYGYSCRVIGTRQNKGQKYANPKDRWPI